MPETVNTDPLLSVPDAAAYLGMSERFVRDRLADGAIPGARLGRYLRIRRSSLEHYIDQASRHDPDSGAAAQRGTRGRAGGARP